VNPNEQRRLGVSLHPNAGPHLREFASVIIFVPFRRIDFRLLIDPQRKRDLMTAKTIDHTTLSRLVEAGAVRGAHVVGQAGGWAVTVKYGMAERSLAAQRSRQVRLFKRMETLVSYLKAVGISRFDVDAARYTPEGGARGTRGRIAPRRFAAHTKPPPMTSGSANRSEKPYTRRMTRPRSGLAMTTLRRDGRRSGQSWPHESRPEVRLDRCLAPASTRRSRCAT